jgi:hypothetical protein
MLAGVALALCGLNAQAASAPCETSAKPECYVAFQPAAGKGLLHYYTSRPAPAAADSAGPTRALIGMHGHPRDAGKTFNAALLAVQRANRLADTLVVAPLFQVADEQAGPCRSKGVPAVQPDDLLWTCESWLQGGQAENAPTINAFAALDALVVELKQRWPSLRTVTVAGFSAGAQMVQHYIAYAADAPGVTVRYVVADPGSWLYFDPVRPQALQGGRPVDGAGCLRAGEAADGGCSYEMRPIDTACPQTHRWKYGTDGQPAHLGRSAEAARARYAQADVQYLQGAQDSGDNRGAYYGILDKSCAAAAQGPYRLQRGLAYAAYDRALLSKNVERQLTVVPGCAHDVACVFPAEAARQALLGRP